MTLKGKRSETLELHANAVQSQTDDISANGAPNHDEIRRRAYEIYLERGGLPGHELEDSAGSISMPRSGGRPAVANRFPSRDSKKD